MKCDTIKTLLTNKLKTHTDCHIYPRALARKSTRAPARKPFSKVRDHSIVVQSQHSSSIECRLGNIVCQQFASQVLKYINTQTLRMNVSFLLFSINPFEHNFTSLNH
jgi:hypothetical protein